MLQLAVVLALLDLIHAVHSAARLSHRHVLDFALLIDFFGVQAFVLLPFFVVHVESHNFRLNVLVLRPFDFHLTHTLLPAAIPQKVHHLGLVAL